MIEPSGNEERIEAYALNFEEFDESELDNIPIKQWGIMDQFDDPS
jgi:hypothetical protein